jgi:excisionase family DNA binding protein
MDERHTFTTAEAAKFLGVSTDALYESVRNGEAPVEPLRIGRAMRWPVKRLMDLVGSDVDPLLLSIPEVARRLSIGRSMAYELVNSGQIATVRIGQRRLIARQELERYVAKLIAES